MAFEPFWAGIGGASVGLGWAGVTAGSMFASAVIFLRRRRAVSAAIAHSRRLTLAGLPLVLLGLAGFVAGSYGAFGGGYYSPWLQLVASLAVFFGLLWSAYGSLAARLLFLPLFALAFVLPPGGASSFSQDLGASSVILALLVISQFDARATTRAALGALALLAGASVWLSGSAAVVLISTVVFVILSLAADALTVKAGAKCPICGDGYASDSPTCASCTGGVLDREPRGSLAPLAFGVSILLIAGLFTFTVVSVPPYGLRTYSIDGASQLGLVGTAPGWVASNQNVRETNSSTNVSYSLTPVQGGSVYNVTLTLRNPGSNSSTPVAARVLAFGTLNESQGIGFKVVNSTGHLGIVLNWQSSIFGRGPNGTTSTFFSFAVSAPYVGTFNRTAITGQLAGPGAVALSLYDQWNGYAADGLYMYEGGVAYAVLSDYIFAGIGAAMIFGLAQAGVWADDRTEKRIASLREINPAEAALLLKIQTSGEPQLGSLETDSEGRDRSHLYDGIESLRSRHLLRVVFSPRRSRIKARLAVAGAPRGRR